MLQTTPREPPPLEAQAAELNRRFGLAEQLRFAVDPCGRITAALRHFSGAAAELCLFGSQVTAWRAPGGENLLYLSPIAPPAGTSFRGGIPLVFPQFGPGKLPSHGFARNFAWQVGGSRIDDRRAVELTLTLDDSPETRRIWPHSFRCEFTLTLDESLRTDWRISNTGPDRLSFQNALHTYFAVSDVSRAQICGLHGGSYIDNLDGQRKKTDGEARLGIAAEIERVYAGAPTRLELLDPAAARRMIVETEGLADVVVWNPWIEKTQRLKDLPADGYTRLLCIETGNVAAPAALSPGESRLTRQSLRVERL